MKKDIVEDAGASTEASREERLAATDMEKIIVAKRRGTG